MFRQIVIDDERVHAVVHEPLAHGGPGKRREILICGAVGSGRRQDRCVGHRAFLFQDRKHACNVGILLSDRDIDAMERPVILIARIFRRLV